MRGQVLGRLHDHIDEVQGGVHHLRGQVQLGAEADLGVLEPGLLASASPVTSASHRLDVKCLRPRGPMFLSAEVEAESAPLLHLGCVQTRGRGPSLLVISATERLLEELGHVPASNRSRPRPLGVHPPVQDHVHGGVGGATVHHDAGLHVEQERDGERLRQQTQPCDLNLFEKKPQEKFLDGERELGRLREHEARVGPLQLIDHLELVENVLEERFDNRKGCGVIKGYQRRQ